MISDKLKFIREFGPVAQKIASDLGWNALDTAVLVAWAAMESNWGLSKLALEAHNLFGIKAGPTWKAQGGDYLDYPTYEWIKGVKTATKASFRRYPDFTASLKDLIHLIKITTIYKPSYAALARGDIQGFFQAIDSSGYSTAPNYASRISNFLRAVSKVV